MTKLITKIIENSIDIEKCLAQIEIAGGSSGGSLENSIDIEKCLAQSTNAETLSKIRLKIPLILKSV